MQIFWHFPHTHQKAFRPKYDRIVWRNNEQEFDHWKNGTTGYVLVDAGMRELNKTGHMHNRVRMLVASFLCKHLLIDWRWGETYFASKLLEEGIYVIGFFYPVVPRGKARIRVQISAAHSEDQILKAVQAFIKVRNSIG